VSHGSGTAALPDDGIVDGLTARLVPDDDGLALIGDADAVGTVLDPVHTVSGRAKNTDEKLLGIMLHVARFGIDLRDGIGCRGNGVEVRVKQNGTRRGRALVKRKNTHICLLW